ncbi:hypothetical protein [Catenuloplanes atrovinosus]|uniref:Uncharacterized protein n=1 Tax=Catenuloplanes atrovinosus TaxID=137266 RepID=A0AAE4C985_9ACTN|nr:hypothetical protein [Catenuloplanes atrovinosus]MDR7276296.1 hypothetical protein [Catenuloplanes atrovinosus]
MSQLTAAATGLARRRVTPARRRMPGLLRAMLRHRAAGCCRAPDLVRLVDRAHRESRANR